MDSEKSIELKTLIRLINEEINSVMDEEYFYVSPNSDVNSDNYNQMENIRYVDNRSYMIYLERLKSKLEYKLEEIK